MLHALTFFFLWSSWPRPSNVLLLSPYTFGPWSMVGLLVVMVRVLGLWIMTTWWPGQKKILVYPLSDILFTLMSNCLMPGKLSASLALWSMFSNVSFVLPVDCSFIPFDRSTSMSDGPVLDKFMSLLMICAAVPESIIIICSCCFLSSCHLSALRVHLFDFDTVDLGGCWFTLLLIFSLVCLSLLSSSGVQQFTSLRKV